ncbi:Ribosome hibernation promoting factor [Desulfovibrionales bacterium]
MNINITFKNFEPSDHLRLYAQRRFEKIAKYISHQADDSELLVTLSVEKFRHKAEVIFIGNYAHLSACEESTDMYSTVDMVLDKIEAQVKKVREKNKDRHRRQGHVRTEIIQFGEGEPGKRERIIIAINQYEPKPMDVDEAAEQLDSLQYEFLVFLNAETGRANVIYRRKNNDFGLIDPEWQ